MYILNFISYNTPSDKDLTITPLTGTSHDNVAEKDDNSPMAIYSK
jgi:hypothetical protein